jgi:hypothetical protein
MNIFNHERLASFTVYISKDNLYIINDNLDSLPNNNFDPNDKILIFTSSTLGYLPNSPKKSYMWASK